MEPVATNLSEIISYRRRNKWEWTELEFKQLTRDLLEGLGELHTKGISHNDIRPSTVYYSSEKNCYLLGSFANCLKN